MTAFLIDTFTARMLRLGAQHLHTLAGAEAPDDELDALVADVAAEVDALRQPEAVALVLLTLLNHATDPTAHPLRGCMVGCTGARRRALWAVVVGEMTAAGLVEVDYVRSTHGKTTTFRLTDEGEVAALAVVGLFPDARWGGITTTTRRRRVGTTTREAA